MNRTYTFDGYSDEADVTTSATHSGDVWDTINKSAQGGSPSVSEIKADTAYSANGGTGVRIRTTDAGGTFLQWLLTGNQNRSYGAAYLKRPALPATRQFVQMRDSGAAIATIRLDTSGHIILVDRGNTTRYTSTKAFSLDEEFRIEWHFSHSLTFGHMEARLWWGANLKGTTPDETLGNQTDNWDTGGGLASIRFGLITAAAAGTNETLSADEFRWGDVDWWDLNFSSGTPGSGFPLVAPDTTGWTILRDPNPSKAWGFGSQGNPMNLQAGVDYVLMGPVGMNPWVRTARLEISGGRNVYVNGLVIDGGDSTTMVGIQAGSGQREIFLEDMYLTNSALRWTDGIRTSGGAGGNAQTGSGGTILKMKRCRIDKLQGDQPTVHADGIQLSGGIKALWMDECTIQSGYVGLQLQREQVVTGQARTITALSHGGTTTASVQVNTGLDIAVEDWVEINNTTPSTWMGTYQVTQLVAGTAPNVTQFKMFLGDGGQASWTSGGTAQKSIFNYYVGDVHMNKVNIRRMDNNSPNGPAQTLSGMRINAGRPDQKGSNAEDRTPLLVDGMAGILDMTDVYVEPNSGETLADMLEPSNAAAVYDLAQGSLNTAPTPDEFSWPSHPKITGVVKHGVPGGGDFAPPPGTAPPVVQAVLANTIQPFTMVLVASTGVSAVLDVTIPPFVSAAAADAGSPPAAVQGAPSAALVEFPTVTWTIDGNSIVVASPSWNENEGGCDQFRGTVTEDAWRQLEALGVQQGSVVEGWAAGNPIWGGTLTTAPLVWNGTAHIAAQGHKYAAAKKDDRLFIQVRGVEGWTPADSEPHLTSTSNNVYPAYKHIDVDISGSRVKFAVSGGQTLVLGRASGIVFYAEGIDLARVAWRQAYEPADETFKLKIQAFKANGPTGTETKIGSGHNVNTSQNGAETEDVFSNDPGDLVGLQLEVNEGFTPDARGVYRLANLRVNSTVNLTDEMTGSEVIAYISGQMGWDTSGIGATGLDVLPFDWQEDWLAAALYVAELEDRYFRVLHDERAEYGAWGDVDWKVAKTQGAVVNLTPLERYDRVEVWYEAVSGVRRRAVAEDTSLGFGLTYKFDLEDRQDSSTLAQAVADTLLPVLSAQRYTGTIECVRARASNGSRNPYEAHYGDTVTVTDFGPSQSVTCRITDVSGTDNAVTFGIEQPVNPVAVVAELMSVKSKAKKKARRR